MFSTQGRFLMMFLKVVRMEPKGMGSEETEVKSGTKGERVIVSSQAFLFY